MVDVTKVELTAQDGATAALNAHRSVVDRLDEAYEQFERNLQRFNTTAASASNVQGKLNDVSANAMRNIVQAATAYVSVTTALNTFMDSVNRMDQIDDMSQKLALNTQSLQENAYAGKLTGVALGTIADANKKLQLSMVAAATGGKEEAAVFKAMGVEIRDANGQMRASEDVMRDMSDVISDLEDGALKTTLASKLLGKSAGPEMVAYLNEGSAGIKRMADEAHAFGGVMDRDAIKAAAEFNDQMDRLKTVTQGAANQVTASIVPAINDLIERFLQGKKVGMGFWEAAGNAASITIARAMGESYAEQIRNVTAEIDDLKRKNEEIKESFNPFSLFGGESLDEDIEKLGKVKKVLQEMQSLRALDGDSRENEDWFDRRFGSRHRANASAIQSALDTESQTKYDTAIQKSNEFIAQLKRETAEVGASTSDKKRFEAEQIAGQMRLAGVRDDVLLRFLNNALKEAEKLEERQKKYKEEEDYKRFLLKATEDLNKAGADTVRQLQDEIAKQEENNGKIGKSKAEVELLAASKLNLAAATEEETAANIRNAAVYAGDLHDAYLQYAKDLEDAAKKKRQLAGLKGEASALETAAEAAKKASEEWKRTSDDIERSLNDALIRGFEGGEKPLENFIKSVRNQLLTAAFKIPVQFVSNSIASFFHPGAAQAAGSMGGGGLGAFAQGVNLVTAGRSLSDIIFNGGIAGGFGSGIGAGISGFGSMVGSSAISGFGSGFAAGAGGADAAMLSYASNIGNVSAGASAGASAGSAFATAMPYLAAAAAIYAIVKSLDDSGTIHTGGAARASAQSGSQTIDARELGFMRIDTTRDAETAAKGIATSIVSLLDSTAATFGKEAGYSAATAFADDTSDDGAWGALRIARGDQTILDWDSNRQSRWAPREYADGEEGRNQYLAGLSASVRDALDGIGLPSWAQSMLDKLGDAPSIQEIGDVVTQINATQTALKQLGETVDGFAGLTDEATLRLVESFGGAENLLNSASYFTQTFLTEAERFEPVIESVTTTMADLGYASVDTKDEFKDLVLGIVNGGQLATEEGAKLYKQLMAIAPAFAAVADYAERAADTVISAAKSSYFETQNKLYEDSRRAEENRQRAQQTWLDNLANQYQGITDRMQETIGVFKEFQKSITDFQESLWIGELSPLSSTAQYDELRARMVDLSVRMENGDQEAYGLLQQNTEQFLRASQQINASGMGYVQDFSWIQALLSGGVRSAGGQISSIQEQIEAAWRQYDTIVSRRVNGSHASGLDRVPYDGYIAELHKDEAVLSAPKAKAYRDGTGGKEMAAALRDQTAAIAQTNELMERLILAVETGKEVSSSDMRSFKQHVSHVLTSVAAR